MGEHRHSPPGTLVEPRRFVPRLHYELLTCGLQGHELIGTDAAELRPEDAIVARDEGGRRWHRCVRCDSWLPLPPPEDPARRYPPARDEIELPLRGRALRDRFVLRLIAIDRVLHFLVLGAIAAAILVFAADRQQLRGPAYRILSDLQGALGGPVRASGHGFLYEVRHLFTVQAGTLTKIGIVVALYALLEGTEAVGLWLAKRWAEYLTFVATTLLLPLEIYEISQRFSVLKVVTLIITLAVVVYLLLAKRLFGLRGGGRAEQAERDRDSGWPAIERATPGGLPTVAPAD